MLLDKHLESEVADAERRDVLNDARQTALASIAFMR